MPGVEAQNDVSPLVVSYVWGVGSVVLTHFIHFIAPLCVGIHYRQIIITNSTMALRKPRPLFTRLERKLVFPALSV